VVERENSISSRDNSLVNSEQARQVERFDTSSAADLSMERIRKKDLLKKAEELAIARSEIEARRRATDMSRLQAMEAAEAKRRSDTQALRRQLEEGPQQAALLYSQSYSQPSSQHSPVTEGSQQPSGDHSFQAMLLDVWQVLDQHRAGVIDPSPLIQLGWPPQDLPCTSGLVSTRAFIDFFNERFKSIPEATCGRGMKKMLAAARRIEAQLAQGLTGAIASTPDTPYREGHVGWAVGSRGDNRSGSEEHLAETVAHGSQLGQVGVAAHGSQLGQVGVAAGLQLPVDDTMMWKAQALKAGQELGVIKEHSAGMQCEIMRLKQVIEELQAEHATEICAMQRKLLEV